MAAPETLLFEVSGACFLDFDLHENRGPYRPLNRLKDFRMQRTLLFFLAAVVTVATAFIPVPVLGYEAPAQATEISNQFMKMLDEEQFAATYDLTSELIRQDFSKNVWKDRLKTFRDQTGKTESRKMASAEQVTGFADLPKGEYIKITYDTAFSIQPKSQEIVVLAPVKDGGFNLVGYEIQYNRWPEAIKIIYRGLIIVFFIMALLAGLTYLVGQIMQSYEKKKKTKATAQEQANKKG